MTGGGSVARRTGNMHRNITVTPFLNKLYSMVDDSASDDLIRWSEDGNSFVVTRHEEFAKDVLPRFFKHSNLSSFVRQLNMYGFHKVPHLHQGGLIADDPDAENWEFNNDNFQRGQPDLLHFIRRKKGSSSNTAAVAATAAATAASADNDGDDGEASDNESDENAAATSESRGAGVARQRQARAQASELGLILKEIQVIRDHQMTISADIKRLQGDNRSLWKQASAAEERYKRHQATIDKILRFLATVFSPENQHAEIRPPLRRLISHTGQSQPQSPSGQGSATRSSGTSTPEKRPMPPASPTTVETLQDGGNYSEAYEDELFSQERPPDKRVRTEQQSASSRIKEMGSGSPPTQKGTKRKVPGAMSTALTRTTNLGRPLSELSAAGSGLGADINALMAAPGSPYGALRTQSKSIEQLQSEIDYLGTSLDNLTRLLQYGGAQPGLSMTPGNMSAAAAAIPGLRTSFAPPAESSASSSAAQYLMQAPLAAGGGGGPVMSQGFDMASVLSSEALNSLAMGLSSDAAASLSAVDSGVLDGTSMGSLGMAGNPPMAAPQEAMYKDSGVDGWDPAVLMEMAKTATPEQFNALQSLVFQRMGGSGGVPLLTADSGSAAVEQSPGEAPFLDFVDANVVDGPISAGSSSAEAGADYTRILLDALSNADAGGAQAGGGGGGGDGGGGVDPLLAASLLGSGSSAQTTSTSTTTPSPQK
ncbi:Heat shock transcription factor [Coemansia sp. RSA 1933]|nr:Heat shock transcription factor [Coemansia sp. RSA 1933]